MLKLTFCLRHPQAREAGKLLLEDEARFIDLAKSPLWLNHEQVVYSGSAGGSG